VSFVKLNELNVQQCVSEFANRCGTAHCSVGVWLAGIESSLSDTEDATMPRVKQASKRKRTTKAATAKVLGAAGLGLSLVGSASASTMPTARIPQADNTSPNQRFVLGEEEMADVSLATFHLFEREDFGSGVQLALGGCGGCGCGAGRACVGGGGGCGGFRGCGGGGFVGGCRGCGGFRGCRGCGCGIGIGFGGCGIGFGFGGCGFGGGCSGCAGCCASWGACRLC
jgi:hypothetical protein